jgi:ribosomal protein S2
MKTKKFKSKQFLKLHFLKSRVYECFIKKTNFNNLKTTNIDQIFISVKKALQIIFQYNQANKRVLFIGLPPKLEFKITSLTRHVVVPASFDTQGIVSNSKTNLLLDLKSITQKFVKPSSRILSQKLMKKLDLIILFDHKNHAILSEAWRAKTPVITFVSNFNVRSTTVQSLYYVNGNFKNILTNFDKNVFFIGLNFLFKNLKKKDLRSFSVLSNSSLPFISKY